MKFHMKSGKMRFSTLIFLIIIVYGGFAAFKVITANIMRTQIKSYIVEQFGYVRGHTFTPEEGEKIIRKILVDNGILTGDMYSEDEDGESYVPSSEEEGSSESDKHLIRVQIAAKNMIHFVVKYSYEIDLLFFKHEKEYTIDETMANY